MTISEFLSITGGEYYDSRIPKDLLSKAMDDFGIPSNTVEFVGGLKTGPTEISLLYKFPKVSEKIGNYLKFLGSLINRLPLRGETLGIQEMDTSRSDWYYILFYLLEEVRD